MNASLEIIGLIGEGAALEQLAEEAAELAQAALKVARIVRHKNPTPIDYETAFYSLIEELGDVRVCIKVLESFYGKLDTQETEKQKLERWQQRVHAFYTGGGAAISYTHRCRSKCYEKRQTNNNLNRQ